MAEKIGGCSCVGAAAWLASRGASSFVFFVFVFFLSSGGWGKIKL